MSSAQLILPLDFSECQRWRNGKTSYRPAGECFNHRQASVELIDTTTAKAFVEAHHYSASFPASRLNVGLFVRRPFQKELLSGVTTFSVPMSQNTIPAHLGVPANEGIELGRLILLDECESNAESWFVARAFRQLRAALPEIKACVSFCDPVARVTADGVVQKRGHVGTVYRALSAKSGRRTKARTLLLMPNGLVANERALAKLRNCETGSDYVERNLRAAGAPPRHLGESGRDYLARLSVTGFLKPLAHPGNYSFSWHFR